MFGRRVLPLSFLLLLVAVYSHAAVTCLVRDAASNLPVVGALCTVRSRTESVLYGSATTDSIGNATIPVDLITQEYLLRVTAPNYYVADDVFLGSLGSSVTRNVPLSPFLNTTGIRAVLRWGQQPSDLDSHVFIVNSTTWSCDEVYYSVKECTNQGVPQPKISLDVDDTTSYGPETVTFSALSPGRYAYWIHIYSSGSFSQSQASVEIYTGATGSGTFQLFNAPADTSTSNTWWHVFDVVVTAESDCTSVNIEPFGTISSNSSTESAPSASLFVGRTCRTQSSVCNTRVTGSWKTCGTFGDPHIVTWDREGVTCRAVGTSLLVDNEWFSLGMTNVQVDATSGATATTSITLIYKQCNALSLTITPDNFPSPANAIDAGLHAIRKVGNNLYMDAINTRLQVRNVGDYLVFGLSTPWWNGTGICNGCPGDELNTTDYSSILGRKRAVNAFTLPQAQAACSGVTGFFYDACIFDLLTTNNDTFVQQASVATTTYAEVQVPFLNNNPPQAPPAPKAAPTPQAGAVGTPSSSASAVIAASAFVFAALLCSALLM